MNIKVKASHENLPPLLLFIEQTCDKYQISKQICLNLQLVVEEACANIIKHGYAKLQTGDIEVTFLFKDSLVYLTITDFGHAFDPTAYPPPDRASEWDQRPVGGLGIFLIRQLMDDVRYTSNPELGNRLELIKRVK